jgi:aryl-alcohol dehydrogenase-like predicted oxidoreductase
MATNGSPARRDFLKQLGLAGAGLLVNSSAQTPTPEKPASQIPRRKFGRYDFTVSSLCLGGHTLRVASDAEARRIADYAFESGVDFWDNCWDYHAGRAEELMGQMLEGRRDKVFLMTKVCSNHHKTPDGKTDRQRAMEMLEDSLRRMKTDHLDLWQLHELASMEQVERAYSKDSTLDALADAKKQGKVRFIGFTGHNEPAVHLEMMKRDFPFDSVQLPVSVANFRKGKDFKEQVVPEALKRGLAILAMKTMSGNGAPILEGKLTAAEALGYALSTGASTVVSGMRSMEDIRTNVRIASEFKPLTDKQVAQLEQRFANDPDSERFAHYSCPGYRDGNNEHSSSFIIS